VGQVKGFDNSSGIVVKQRPLAGQKVSAGATVDFEVSK
jgi:beta-lactam-binding protein with PASTA domain